MWGMAFEKPDPAVGGGSNAMTPPKFHRSRGDVKIVLLALQDVDGEGKIVCDSIPAKVKKTLLGFFFGSESNIGSAGAEAAKSETLACTVVLCCQESDKVDAGLEAQPVHRRI